MKNWFYIFILLLTGELCAQEPFPAGFFPLKPGNQWFYTYFDFGWTGRIDTTKDVYKVMDTMTVIEGRSYYVIKQLNSSSASYMYLRMDSTGYYRYSPQFNNHEFKYFDPRPLKEGDSWKQRKAEHVGKDSIFYTSVMAQAPSQFFGRDITFTSLFVTDSALGYSTNTWANEFGLLRQTYEGGEYNLAGCIINNVPNGNTSMNVVAVENSKASPSRFELEQNYPNPFNPSTQISFQVPEASMVTLRVFDMLGKEVATLVNEYKSAGSHTVQFNASNLPSGMYIYQLRAGENISLRKMMLLK
ncbi:MAG: T9SS type A sorting domain-containing protein [Acidobacteriota bacterium]